MHIPLEHEEQLQKELDDMILEGVMIENVKAARSALLSANSDVRAKTECNKFGKVMRYGKPQNRLSNSIEKDTRQSGKLSHSSDEVGVI